MNVKALGSVSLLAAALASAAISGGSSEDAKTGPLVPDFGPVYDVPRPEFATPVDRDYRVVFDVVRAPDDDSRIPPSVETVARFLNMHARAGVPEERLHAALVLHGDAGKYALGHEGYRERFGGDNPGLALIQRLHDAGVRVILCGQTAASRGFPREELTGDVELALSAMTALVTLQQDGYQLIAF